MRNSFVEVIRIIFTLIVIIFAIVSSILIFIKIFGNSPSDTTVLFSVLSILVALQVVIIGALFKIMEVIGSLKADVIGLKEFRGQTVDKIKEIEERFEKVGRDNK